MKRPLVGSLGTLALGLGAFTMSATVRAEEAKPATLTPTAAAPVNLEAANPGAEPAKTHSAGAGIGLNPNQPVLNAGATVNSKDAESLTATTSSASAD